MSRHRRLILLAYLLAVLLVMLVPVDGSLPLHSVAWVDKGVHFALFVGVAVLGHWNVPRPVVVLVFATAFAAGIELLQATLPYRTMDTWDLVAGALGAAAGLGLVFVKARGTRSDDPGVSL